MSIEYEKWLDSKDAGGRWAGKALALVTAGVLSTVVGLAIILMAALERPVAPSVRYAAPLPPVAVVGRRQPDVQAVAAAGGETSAKPLRTPSAGSRSGLSAAGDNLRQ